MKIILVYKNKQINNPRVFEKLKQTDQYFLRLSIARNASKFIHLVIESPIIDIVQENSTDKIIPTVQQAFENKKKRVQVQENHSRRPEAKVHGVGNRCKPQRVPQIALLAKWEQIPWTLVLHGFSGM